MPPPPLLPLQGMLPLWALGCTSFRKPCNNPFMLNYDKNNFKGSVCVNSSDPSCKDDNALFTTVSLKALSDQV